MAIKIAEYNGTTTTLWTLSDTQATPDVWNWGQLSYQSNVNHRIYIEETAGTSTKNFVGVDDIIFKVSLSCLFRPLAALPPKPLSTAPPETTPTTIAPIKELDCDFEIPCSWFNSPNNTKANWTITKASSSQFVGSPQNDHTLENNQGSFLTLDSTNYYPKTTVLFSSPLMNGTKCIEFWYYMYGSEVGTLSLFRKTPTSVPGKIFTTTSSSQPQWLLAQATSVYLLPSQLFTASIEFSFTEAAFNGFVGIDDLIVHEGRCVATNLCTFEDDMCGYTNDIADFNWQIGTGSSSSASTGPQVDVSLIFYNIEMRSQVLLKKIFEYY